MPPNAFARCDGACHHPPVEPLDNAVWHALTGLQSPYAEGTPPAVRFRPDVSVFAGLPDEITPAAWDALADLIGPAAETFVARGAVGPEPDGWTVTFRLTGQQMVGPRPGGPRPAPTRPTATGVDVIELAEADVADMTALVDLTEPGPFEARTIELGTYLGVRDGGELIAMAGQRVRIDGHTEISAVCTRPDHRGKGLAGLLVDVLVDEIHGRGDVPFLNTGSSNTVAISRYLSLGFEIRRQVEVLGLISPD